MNWFVFMYSDDINKFLRMMDEWVTEKYKNLLYGSW